MTSQDRLLSLHDTMIESCHIYFRHTMSLRSYKTVLKIAVIGFFTFAGLTYLGMSINASWSLLTMSGFTLTLVVIPLSMMARAFDKKKLKPLGDACHRDAGNYQAALHRAIIAHGYSDKIIPQNDPREGYYQCYVSKDGVVSTVTASVYDDSIVFNVEEEPNVLIHTDSGVEKAE